MISPKMYARSKPEESHPKEPADGVPQALIDEMHEKTKHLTQAREKLDESIDANEFDSEEKRDTAVDEASAAEKDIEKTDEKIKPELKKTDPA